MTRQVRILSGLHAGAEVSLTCPEQQLIGSDQQCAIVLCDPGIAARHFVIATDAYGSTCRAVDAAVRISGRELKCGETASIEDCEVIECGTVALAVGPLHGDWSAAHSAWQMRRAGPLEAVRSLRRINPYGLFVSVMLGIACVVGLAYAALSEGEVELTSTRVEAARQWLEEVSPDGSELTIGVEAAPGQSLLLSGYVQTSRQLTALTTTSKASQFAPRVDVHAIEDMTDSLARLARLAGVPCETAYQGSGNFSCVRPVAGEPQAQRLRTVARDVPGVRSLNVAVVAPVAAAAPSPVLPPPLTPLTPLRLTQKFSVLMVRDQRYLIGPHGERYREGQQFDGFTIDRIGIDQVMFERDGRKFEFQVAALRAAR